MERIALLLLTTVLVVYVIIGIYAGLRRKDAFWDQPAQSRGRKRPAESTKSSREH